jgi:tetratricopeptide (TPR) repeat protein
MRKAPPKKKAVIAEIQVEQKVSEHLKIYLGLIIAAFAFLLYANGIKNNYTLDDVAVVKDNKVTTKGLGGIPMLLKTDYWYGYMETQRVPEYRPASLIAFAILWQFFPNSPHIFHLFNVLLFAITCFVLFFVLCELLKRRAAKNWTYHLLFPFICTLLYAAHPIHTEVVDSIKSLDEILCFLFALIAVYFLFKCLSERSIVSLSIGSSSFFLCLISKETGITYLLLIPLIIFFFTIYSFEKISKYSLVLLIVAGVYFMIRYFVLKDLKQYEGASESVLNNSLHEAPNFMVRLGTVFYVLLRYILILIFPHPLSSDYNYAQIKFQDISDPLALFSLAVYLFLGIYALIKLKKKSILAFSILFFFITLTPVSNLFLLIGATMAERFMYMPSLGFCIILSFFILKYTKGKIQKGGFDNLPNFFLNNSLPLIIVAGIAVLYSLKTISRTVDWKDNISLFASAAKVSENSATVHLIYGTSLYYDVYPNEKEPAKRDSILTNAIKELNKGLEILRTSKTAKYAPMYNYHLATAYMDKNDLQNAMINYEIYLQKFPNPNPEVYNKLSSIYGILNLNDKAMAIDDSVIKYFPPTFNAYYAKGLALSGKQEFDKAVIQFQKALELNPNNPDLFYNIGLALNNLNRLDEALKVYSRAIELKPDYVEAFVNRANILNNGAKYGEALKDYNKAIALRPGFSLAYNNRGNAYAGEKKYEQAIQDYSKAIELDPNYSKAYFNRGFAEINSGKKDNACGDFRKSIELGYSQAQGYLQQFCK